MSISVHIKKQLKEFELSIDFDMNQTCMGMLGESGCGKSMTLKCIAGIETPDSGRIVLNGRTLFDSERKINLSPQKRRVGYLFQNYALFPNMTVYRNVEAGLSGLQGRFSGWKEKEAQIHRLLETFHIAQLAHELPSRLSGGQQQRVALARMLASEPEILLLDEPFSALDSYLKEKLLQEMKGMLKQYEKDVIMVSHSRDEIYQMCPRMAVMHRGSLEVCGDTAELFQNPQTVSAARLTGCKNIVRAEPVGERELFAPDWGMRLQVNENISGDIRWVGIRAHDFRTVEEMKTGPVNVMECRLERITEAPFEVYLMLQNAGRTEQKTIPVWWKISKKEWGDMNEKVPDRICFPPEHLILLRDS